MGRYHLDEDEKRIARATVRLDDKLRQGKIRHRETPFDKRARAAVEKANADMDIEPELLDKIRANIISGITWEHSGETYVGRDTFYRYARHYLYYVARALGVVEDRPRKNGGG